ncbi:hypothetical protein [Burkholderia cenocepacia]|uniref:hypothetical protein n=1 Tax=Burkholderia cenocepacia TaxID=95486 RepID=UPI003D769586
MRPRRRPPNDPAPGPFYPTSAAAKAGTREEAPGYRTGERERYFDAVGQQRADARKGRLARFDALRIEIRALITEISHAADVELLDLMADEIGSFARHKAVQEARTWAATAAITLETGLMQLARATLPINEQ